MKKLSDEELKERKRIRNKAYREKNKKVLTENKKKYREENKVVISEYRKLYREENKDKIKEYYDGYKEIRNEKARERYKLDELYKLTKNIRTAISNSFRNEGYSKTSRTQNILGCSFEQLKLHLESQFEDWMTWDNYGKYNCEFKYGWDIDHIIPLSSANTIDDLLKLNDYKNLQPLCSKINREIKKGNY
jgi:hypothetical protein